MNIFKVHTTNVKRVLLLIFLLFGISALSSKTKKQEVLSVMNGNSILQIKATVLYPSFIQPWRFKNPETRYSSGVYVGNGLVLVPAQAIYFYTNIEIKKYGSLHNYQAKLERMDPDLGLALLKVSESGFDKGLSPIVFPEEINFPSKSIVVENEEFRNLQEKSIKLVRMDVDYYSNGYLDLPYIEIKSEERLEGIGELIIDEVSRLPQGVLYQFKAEQNTGRMIPCFMIRQFISGGNFPFKGFRFRPLTDATSREYYGIKKENQGVLIAEVVPNSSAFGNLNLEDVLLEVSGYKIDPKGYFEHPKFGKLPLSFLFHVSTANSKLKLQILRQKKIKEIEIVLKEFNLDSIRIPFGNTRFIPPKYLIFGGIVFTELSESYLLEFGNQWRSRVNKELLYLNDFHKFKTNPSDRPYVIISSVLPLDGNKTYHGFQQIIVQKFNGSPVFSLKHLKELLITNKEEIIRIETNEGSEIFFYSEELKLMESEVQKTFRIPKMSNFE